ncbi:MAG: hypothetical protein N2234_03570 [Planctomycetota bacterium]|nr:hypothetical protein [Planctomycetota bacterium]
MRFKFMREECYKPAGSGLTNYETCSGTIYNFLLLTVNYTVKCIFCLRIGWNAMVQTMVFGGWRLSLAVGVFIMLRKVYQEKWIE